MVGKGDKVCRAMRAQTVNAHGTSPILPISTFAPQCLRYDASVFMDECHATGFFGATGRGTDEHCGVQGRVDVRVMLCVCVACLVLLSCLVFSCPLGLSGEFIVMTPSVPSTCSVHPVFLLL